MENVDVFVTIAEIAGVFVGFAALISATRRPDIEGFQLSQIQALVTIGLLVVVAALVPVGLAAYGMSERALWVTSAFIYLVINWVSSVLALRRPENRFFARNQLRASPASAALFWVLELLVQVPLLLVIFGVNQDLDRAFYLTAIVVHVFEAALILAQLVYSQAAKREA